ncbi:MAG: SGNH/GDSL hydrolase family protein [Candidatus Hydrogenedentota bacterium]
MLPLSVGVLWALIEIGFLVLLQVQMQQPQFRETAGRLYVPHPRLGFGPRPGVTVRAEKRRGNEVAYTCTYTITEEGRRFTPVDQPGKRGRFALFFGGSFTFGQGVDDPDTLPAQFGEAAPSHQPYNYGFCAYGPQSMYLQVNADDFADDVRQDRGVVVYTFLDEHMLRLMGSARIATTWGANLPHITRENGGIVHHGGFGDSRPARQFVYRMFRHLPTVSYFRLDYPPPTASWGRDLLTAVFVETRDRLQARFENVAFYVLFYPETKLGPSIAPQLQAAGVEYVDYSDLFHKNRQPDATYYLPDGHPTAAGHAVVARQLAADLGLTAHETACNGEIRTGTTDPPPPV